MNKKHILENFIGSVINFFILTRVPFFYMERAGFMTCIAVSHQGAIKEPTASLFRTCEAHLVSVFKKNNIHLNHYFATILLHLLAQNAF